MGGIKKYLLAKWRTVSNTFLEKERACFESTKMKILGASVFISIAAICWYLFQFNYLIDLFANASYLYALYLYLGVITPVIAAVLILTKFIRNERLKLAYRKFYSYVWMFSGSLVAIVVIIGPWLNVINGQN